MGVAKVKITPSLPCDLAGFSHRTSQAEEKYGDLYLRTTILESGGIIVCLAVADIIWWDDELVVALRRELSNKENIPEQHFHFIATHTHSGPQVSGRFSKQLGKYHPEFVAELKQNVIANFTEAKANMQPVQLKIKKTVFDMSIYRRKWCDGKIEMLPNPAVAIDQDLTVMSFINEQSQDVAMWIHYACHPTSTDATILSGEFPGVCTVLLEQSNPDCVVSFLQGFSGDIRPNLVKAGAFYRGTLDEMITFGKQMSEQVLALNNQSAPFEKDLSLKVSEKTVPLVYDFSYDFTDVDPELLNEWQIKKDHHMIDHLRLTTIRLTENLTFALANAEMVSRYAAILKQKDSSFLSVGYANGMIGYVPSKIQLFHGGYEAEGSIHYFSLKGKLHPRIEGLILQKFDQLLKGDGVMTALKKLGEVDLLSFEIHEDRKSMGISAGKKAADTLKAVLAKKEEARVIFACAPSQNEMIEQLLADPEIEWSRVVGFHMDEYIGIPADSEQTFQQYIKDHLTRKKTLKAFHFIDSTMDPEEMIRTYSKLINDKPIDLVCLGIGENGHIAFNDPDVANFQDPQTVKRVALDNDSRQQQVNDGCFARLEDVPTHALTLTIPALMRGHTLICTVPGKTKTRAINNVLYGEISTSCPATILRTHPNAHLYFDKEAYGDKR